MQRKSHLSDTPAGAHWLVVIAALLQIATPLLPSLGVGNPIGSQSDSVRTLITPAGWAFSIWGALYTGSLAFAVYQWLPAQRHSRLLTGLRLPAANAFLGNAAWAAYVQLFGLSLISAAIITFTLVNLLAIYRRLNQWASGFSSGERWLIVLPLSALTSWLTVATIVNLAASLRFHGVEASPGGAPLIAAAVVVVGGLIAGTVLLRTGGNPPYALVFLWALSAIYTAGGQRTGFVALAAAIAAIVVVAASIMGMRRGGIEHWLAGHPRQGADPVA